MPTLIGCFLLLFIAFYCHPIAFYCFLCCDAIPIFRFVERLLPNLTPREHLADDLIEMDASGATVRQAATTQRRVSVTVMADLGASTVGSPGGSRKGTK